MSVCQLVSLPFSLLISLYFFSLLAGCQLAVGCLTSFVSVHLSVNPLVSLLVGLLVCLLDSLIVACQLVCRLVVLSVGIHRPSVS